MSMPHWLRLTGCIWKIHSSRLNEYILQNIIKINFIHIIHDLQNLQFVMVYVKIYMTW